MCVCVIERKNERNTKTLTHLYTLFPFSHFPFLKLFSYYLFINLINYCTSGFIFYEKGATVNKFYMVLSGIVKMDGQKVVLLAPDAYFGEAELILNKPSESMASVSENCILATIEKDAFFRLALPVKELLSQNVQNAIKRTLKRRQSPPHLMMMEKSVSDINTAADDGIEKRFDLVGIPLCSTWW